MPTHTVDNVAPQLARPSGIRGPLRKVFSFPVFIGALLAAAACTITTAGNPSIMGGKLFTEGDIWWQVAVGETILSGHRWPTMDPYSFPVQNNFGIAYEWLGNVVVAIAVRARGLQGMALLLVLLSIAFVLLIYYYSWLRSNNFMSAAVATAALLPIIQATAISLRAQLIGYIFLLITLISLERFRQGHKRALWILPGIFLLWVNTHPSFVLGFLVLGLSWVSGFVRFESRVLVAEQWTGAQRRHLSLVSLACLLATTVTPYGVRLVAFPIGYMMQETQRYVTEWGPLGFSSPFAKLFLALIIGFAVAQLIAPVALRLDVLALLLFTVIESCLHTRFLILFPIVFCPVLARLLARWLPPYRPAEDHRVVNVVLITVLAWGIIAFFPSEAELRQMLRRNYPLDAVAYIRQHPVPTGMFNEVEWGGFLTWSLGPQHRVFIDGRGDIYKYAGVIDDYLRITAPDQDALTLLNKYNIRACLLHRAAPLATLLSASPDWKLEYSDEQSIIFARAGETRR